MCFRLRFSWLNVHGIEKAWRERENDERNFRIHQNKYN